MQDLPSPAVCGDWASLFICSSFHIKGAPSVRCLGGSPGCSTRAPIPKKRASVAKAMVYVRRMFAVRTCLCSLDEVSSHRSRACRRRANRCGNIASSQRFGLVCCLLFFNKPCEILHPLLTGRAKAHHVLRVAIQGEVNAENSTEFRTLLYYVVMRAV